MPKGTVLCFATITLILQIPKELIINKVACGSEGGRLALQQELFALHHALAKLNPHRRSALQTHQRSCWKANPYPSPHTPYFPSAHIPLHA